MAKILLIDDDQTLRELLALTLQLEGHEIVVAENGEAGLRNLRETGVAGVGRFDLVTVDFLMPAMDGLRFLRALQAEFGAAAPPVVAVTAVRRADVRNELAAAGAAAVVCKPVQRDELLAILSTVMQSRAA
jgi:chemosensory pili system protein ChpA (sensor histidine kinase/response regulator)